MEKENFISALKELRQSEKRNFDQSVDLIINLRDFDLKRNSVNIALTLPYPAKKQKICAFLENPSSAFDYVVLKKDFDGADAKVLKKIVKDYNFCVASAKLMPEIARRFGRVLGQAGKMPDPKAGCVIMNEDENTLNRLANELRKKIKIRAKEKSIKVVIGKESRPDDELAENASFVYSAVLAALPKNKENIKNVMLKLTMSKPIKIIEKNGEEKRKK